MRFVERRACAVCGSERTRPVWTGRLLDRPWREWIERHHYRADLDAELGKAEIELRRCAPCGMLFHGRVLDPGSSARLYSQWIDSEQVERFEREELPDDALFEQGRQVIKHLLRVRRISGGARPRIVDIGCGDGRALQLARLLGFEAAGIDPSATRDRRASELGLEIWPSIDSFCAAGVGPADAVLMMQVLEHVVDPRSELRRAASLVRAGGVLILEVPDATGIGLPPRTFEELRVVQPLEHVNAFVPATLRRLACEAGLVPIRTIASHATTRLRDVVRSELARWTRRATTSQYFVKPFASPRAV